VRRAVCYTRCATRGVRREVALSATISWAIVYSIGGPGLDWWTE